MTTSLKQPVATVNVGGSFVHVFPPSNKLWSELAELDSLADQTPDGQWISRQPIGNDETGLCAPFTVHVLETVVRHCTDSTFEGPPQDLVRLLVEILKSW